MQFSCVRVLNKRLKGIFYKITFILLFLGGLP